MIRGRFSSSLASLRYILCVMIFLTILWGTSIVSEAAFDATQFETNPVFASYDSGNFYVYKENGRQIGTSNKYAYTKHFSFDLSFMFHGPNWFIPDKPVVAYDFSNALYNHSYSGITDGQINNMIVTYKIYSYDGELIADLGNVSSNQFLVSVPFVNSNYFFVRVHYEFDLNYIIDRFPSYDRSLVSFRFTFRHFINTWDVYDSSNWYYRVESKIDALAGDNAGIKGAVEEGNKLQEQGNQLQAEENRLQEEANETSKNIFQKISDFFAGFFEGIINAFKSLFIPEDGYFSEYFGRLNDFFADKLGMLYAPIDMFISVLNGFLNASASDAGIPFPGIKWGDTYFIEPQTVSLTEILSNFPELQEKIYFVTNIVMIGAVLLLLQNKLKGVLNR